MVTEKIYRFYKTGGIISKSSSFKKIKRSKTDSKGKSKKKKKTSKQSGKERANNPPDWAKREKYDQNKTAGQNAKEVLDKKYGKDKWAGSEYSKIKKWLQRSKDYK